MGEFRMPSLGADMERGTLEHWYVQPGDRVKRGDLLCIVHTDKGAIDVEGYEDGVVERLVARAGDTLPVGEVLAVIGAGQPVRASPTARRAAAGLGVDLASLRGTGPRGVIQKADVVRAAARVPAMVTGPAEETLSMALRSAMEKVAAASLPTAPEPRQRASPLARRRAADLGVDLATVTGTGPDGAVQAGDVERVAAALRRSEEWAREAPAPPEDDGQGMRRAIAAAMARSNREIPHYYLQASIDMSRSLRWLEEQNRERPIRERLLPAVLLIRAVCRGLRAVPELNGFWVDGRHEVREEVHLGFAVNLRQGGLVTPALLDAHRKSPAELMAALGDLVGRARAGRLRSSELTQATITVTSLGDQGVEAVYGVIYPPQVALVGFGRIAERPWAEGGMLGVRPVVTATLAGDHRATDGRQGARFLEAVDRALQHPEEP